MAHVLKLNFGHFKGVIPIDPIAIRLINKSSNEIQEILNNDFYNKMELIKIIIDLAKFGKDISDSQEYCFKEMIEARNKLEYYKQLYHWTFNK